MNRIIKKSIWTGCLMLAVLMGVYSCTDDWDSHYDGAPQITYDGNLMQFLKSEADVSDFVEILQATGYDRELEASQVLTVFAPKNGSFDKTELLKLIADGKKQRVIDQFVMNHVCRYAVSITEEEQDKVALLNNKIIKVGTLADPVVQGVDVEELNQICKNGVVHVLDGYLPYEYSIYEFLQKDYEDQGITPNFHLEMNEEGEEVIVYDDDDSFFGYLNHMELDSLDEAHSVFRDRDKDQNPIWVDKVYIKNNNILSPLDAFLFREDSTYLTIIPSDEAYKRRYEGIHGLFNFNESFNSDPEYRDSLQRFYAHYYTMADLNYNLHMNNDADLQTKTFKDGTEIDSLFSTVYKRNVWPYHDYHQPYGDGGLLANCYGLTKCSNGWILRSDEMPFDVYTNIFRKLKTETELVNNIYRDGDDEFTNTKTTSFESVANSSEDVSGTGYIHIKPAGTRDVKITYYLANTLSGEYDIYIKFLPYSIYDPEDVNHVNQPVQFRVSLYEQTEPNGGYPDEKKPTYKFMNPKDGKVNFQTDPDNIDIVYIGSYKFQYCYHNTNPGVLLKIESYVTSQNKIHTKEMFIDQIILQPKTDKHNSDGLYLDNRVKAKRRWF